MAKSGPGKHFRNGLSLVQVTRMFPDDATAEKWIAQCRWDGNPACPHCGSVNVQTGAKHPSQPYRCREKGCRKFFSVKTGTAMAGSNLGYQVWAIASYLLATGLKGQASMKLHRDLGISQKAAWFLAHRLRETWETQQALFAGPVEVDETYMGGKEKKQASGQEGEPRAGSGRQDCRGRREGPGDESGGCSRGRSYRQSYTAWLRARPGRGWSQSVHGRSEGV